MVLHKDNFTELMDNAFTLKCPHCLAISNTTLISPPQYPFLSRYRPRNVGVSYMCNACKEPIFLKFEVVNYDIGNYRIVLNDTPQQIEFPSIDFEFDYIPEIIRSDFKEALSCYSIGSLNAFAAMCRRTIQSVATDMGVKGKDKVQKQIQELKEIANVDDETYEIINQIILEGHDGSHPHLPTISAERSEILLALMKDVMYQFYVRKGKIKKAAELRSEQIKAKD